MPPNPTDIIDVFASEAAERPRPYGFLGLILSLLVILSLTIVFALIEAALGVAVLAARHELPWALRTLEDLRQGVESAAAKPIAQRLDVVLGIGVYVAMILAVFAVARFRGGREWTELVALRRWRRPRRWALFAGLFALTLVWEVAASLAIEKIHPQAKDWVSAPKETPWLIGFLILAVVFGPFAEEVVFRGWMYTSLRARAGLRVAVLVTSVLFAVAHWESTHLYALAVFPIGLALAIMRERTGTIVSSFTFHALYNGAATALLFVGK